MAGYENDVHGKLNRWVVCVSAPTQKHTHTDKYSLRTCGFLAVVVVLHTLIDIPNKGDALIM